jgi:copper chaperone CopZ
MMQNLKKTFLVVFCLMLTVAATAHIPQKRLYLHIDDTCGGCKEKIENAAKSLDGVMTACYDTVQHFLFVAYKPNRVTGKCIIEAEEEAGFHPLKTRQDCFSRKKAKKSHND